jgi:hypothetical protein
VLRVGAQTTGEGRRDKRLCGLGDDMVPQVFPAGQWLVVAHRQRLGPGELLAASFSVSMLTW